MGRGPSIEGRKNAEDARRGKIFTKLIREITVAARNGADPAGNARLRIAIDKALSSNMSKDTIERAVRRGSGADGADDMQELRYEGYGPAGVALIIDAMTDNPVRTVADVRHALGKHGGNLGTSGSVAFQFARLGEIVVDTSAAGSEDRVLEAALDAGADDVAGEGGRTTVVCAPDAFEAVKKAVADAGFEVLDAGVVMRPANRVAVSGEAEETLRDLLDWLDGLDDVQEVYHNAVLPD
ncbi:MAG TPA: YebC/PmpR family DNA-binding transcriptional regulator [Dokdonella sp.]|uniref:YebC/PmpR family DNA-binding transcriptional regulator n=1 Tax=Dokdonella sp. TaxID=2291710 RepID=UPI0025C60F69|nr:YebC/PmpR family DNA-binding transcriptional regulator [Dokdonella sp.]MBX3693148.1 YebC/PmpR family DNA-binding transcriptional regulator [Dokdonella sp.]MCW5567479.1 YebC/PmpR family DNA-binding transcriptional regulator [Dokdonella sp.]HNR92374.1 YebC/PmpR family DNA-binding transcriptional regulator [Dokdonella sp.]